MRYLFSIALVLILASFMSMPTGITKEERDSAINYLKETGEALIEETRDLTDNQLNWKPADSVWSVANNVEHLTISEKNLFDWAMATLKEPADPSKRSQVKNTDDQVKAMLSDRSFRVKTQESFQPSGQFGSFRESLVEFKKRRGANVAYIRKTEDDLRNHYAETPFGLADTYQVLLFMAAHSRRHTLQIQELKGHPDFPKK